MRTSADRLRHTILFETCGLVTITPLAAWILDRDMTRIGAMAFAISILAMATNFFFNLLFDHVLVWLGRPVNVRPPWMRALHAICFESTLLLSTMPLVAWWLDMPLWQAFATNLGFSLFYLAYAYVYNWAYDVIFPMPVNAESR